MISELVREINDRVWSLPFLPSIEEGTIDNDCPLRLATIEINGAGNSRDYYELMKKLFDKDEHFDITAHVQLLLCGELSLCHLYHRANMEISRDKLYSLQRVLKDSSQQGLFNCVGFSNIGFSNPGGIWGCS